MFDWITADGDLAPILIYLVIFVFWAIGKALTTLNKSKPSPPAKPPARPTRGGKTIDPTLKEFLETLTGQTIETEPEPEATPAPPQAPVPPVRPLAQPPRRPPPVRPRPQPSRPPPQPQPEPAPVEEPVFDIESMEADIYQTREAPANVIESTEIGEHDHFMEQTLGSLSALAGMEALRIPMPSFMLPAQRENCEHRNHIRLRHREEARRAMIERIILGPPRCMQPDAEDQQTLLG